LRDVLIPETLDVVFEENNGALVLVAGSLNIQDTLKDDFYGISMAAVKMRKVVQVSDSDSGTQDTCSLVQVYQWYETEDSQSHNTQAGDHDNHVEKSYSYDTDWFDHHIDSSNFANTLGNGVWCTGAWCMYS
jgi:signal recognition particle receptor subunit beta